MKYVDDEKNISIIAKNIEISETASFGDNINIRLKGNFSIGNRSRLGNNVTIHGNNVTLGDDLYHSSGLRVGGGGRFHPSANLSIGNRCTIHNNFLNVAEPITIGDDVGLSQEVSIITHGYWLSVLEGFPAKFAGVKICNGAILGYRTTVLMGTTIGENAVVAANSVVTKNLDANSIYAGNPARFIRKVTPLNQEERIKLVEDILETYSQIAKYHSLSPDIEFNFPIIRVNNCRFDVETLEMSGQEDIETDDFRDYIRKWGLRYYSNRPFTSNFSIEE
ncbi:MAG: acyltransferase [Candidatus Kariarchaeaceae archaeon]